MLNINKLSRTPIYEQIIDEVEKRILQKVFVHELPSVRQLSQTLSINPNTLQKAFLDLENRGICYSVPGSGRFVAQDAIAIINREKKSYLKEIEEQTKILAMNNVSEEEIIQSVQKAYQEYLLSKEGDTK